MLLVVGMVFVAASVYFLPSIIAFSRRVKTAAGVFVVNLFLG